MSSLSATSFKYDFAGKKFGPDWLNPIQELFGVAFVFLNEVSPLPTEALGGRSFIAIYFFEVCKSGNSAGDRETATTTDTSQAAFENLIFLFDGGRKSEVLTAHGAH